MLNSIAHLHKSEDLENCFDCVKKHMKSDAKFILDFFNPDLNLLTRDENEVFPIMEYLAPDTNEKVILKESGRYDKVTQVKHCNWYYQTGEREFSHTLNMRVFYPQELDMLLKYNGFKIEEKYGNFDKSEFVNSSPKQVLVCGRIN